MIAVCIATYNQEAFIGQAVVGVQKQVCDEPVRIYIGDDASSDGTRAICEQLAREDKRIVYVRREKNAGLVANTIDLYRRIMADGCEYIAMLDGDDYWTDENKLQEQVDYLRSHPETGFVHTAAWKANEGVLTEERTDNVSAGDLRMSYDFAGANQTNSTVLFRSSLLRTKDLEAIQAQAFRMLDYPLYGIFSQQTQFGFIPSRTTAFRIHHSVSNPSCASAFLSYQYHYARAWRWLDKRYDGHFHFRWYKVVSWYLWQVVYAVIHYSKIRIKASN